MSCLNSHVWGVLPVIQHLQVCSKTYLILWDNGKATKPAHLTAASMNLPLSPPSVSGHNSAASFVLAQAVMQWWSKLVVQPKQKIQQPRKIALTDQCTTLPAAMPLCSKAKAVVVNTHNCLSAAAQNDKDQSFIIRNAGMKNYFKTYLNHSLLSFLVLTYKLNFKPEEIRKSCFLFHIWT